MWNRLYGFSGRKACAPTGLVHYAVEKRTGQDMRSHTLGSTQSKRDRTASPNQINRRSRHFYGIVLSGKNRYI
ncbi:MAG: hypothetical protein RID09_22015 [Coleofasciculus sp. G1-WW12-02]|uniref:hypothetical protein n=1 Tax=Coleofasciculus sp. G1-WW12-02 TaxID=3068483 RepID=UPI0032F2E79B